MRLLLLGLVLLASTSSADAQRRGRAIAEQGDLAVTVAFNGLNTFTISPLEGGIGLRYWAGGRTVLGTSIAVGGEDSSAENLDTRPLSEGTLTRISTTSSERQSASLSVWTEQHLGRRHSTVSPFVGAALRVGYADDEQTQGFEDVCTPVDAQGCTEGSDVATSSTEAVSIGGGLILGAEVKVVNRLTLSGAYTLGVTYQNAERLETRERRFDGRPFDSDRDLVTIDGWQFGVGTTTVALSVYF